MYVFIDELTPSVAAFCWCINTPLTTEQWLDTQQDVGSA